MKAATTIPTTTTSKPPKAATEKKATPAKPKPSFKPGAALKGSADAKRRAAVVLEVLSGLRSPYEASVLLGVSPQRYYMLESRALQGLVDALEPRSRGPQPSPERDLRRVTAQKERLERELLRAQALVRVAQRTVGITPPPDRSRDKVGKSGKRRKLRTPVVRARQAAERLRDGAHHDADMTTPEVTTQASATATSS